MCGIAGIYHFQADCRCPEIVKRMCDELVHRGPDGFGEYSNARIQMGMRRLAIIDLKTGDQPFFSPDGTIAVVMNGEIYNYQEIREHYKRLGYHFRSASDTEVLIPLYLDYGQDFVRHLNGMFGIALYDGRTENLILARDRMGIKPLLYSKIGGRLFFCSEMRAITAVAGPLTESPQALDAYFTLGYFPAPLTVYQEVERVEPGCLVCISPSGIEKKRFWSISFSPSPMSEEDAIRKSVRILESSVTRQLVSDVPVGLFLGGGLDSAALALIAARKAGKRLHAYTVAFEESQYDESPQARLVAEASNVDIHVLKLSARELADMLPARISAMAEPFMSWASCSIQFISRAAREHMTVVLTGSGGDELFGGYPTLTAHKLARFSILPPGFYRWAADFIPRLPAAAGRADLQTLFRAFGDALGHSSVVRYVLFKQLLSAKLKVNMYHPDYMRSVGIGMMQNTIEKMLEELHAGVSEVDRLLFLDMRFFLGSCSLHSFDHAMMAESIEGRVPFLDNEMIDFALSVPHRFKHRFLTTKMIFRKALQRLLPREIVNMPKKGFTLPLSSWLRSGPIRELMDEIFLGKKIQNDPYINGKAAFSIYSDHVRGKCDHGRTIAMLASYYIWRHHGIF